MLLEIAVLLATVVLLFWLLIPALIDALHYLFVAVIYMSVVIAAFGLTAVVFMTLYCEPDEPTIEDLTDNAVRYLDTTSVWLWNRWT